jgi:crotonobetainyl-CoA:carnitine CoA-transferase CaiB-like acyl-CoA transferase
MPARVSSWCVYEPFPSRDGKLLFVAITTDSIWKRFCEAFALTDLLRDPELQTNEQRVKGRPRILPIIADIVARHDIADMMKKLEALSVPFAPLATPGDLFDDPHLNHGNRMFETELVDGQRLKLPGLPIEMDGHELGVRRNPPVIGEHTREVLLEAGFTEAEIAAMAAVGKATLGTRSAR